MDKHRLVGGITIAMFLGVAWSASLSGSGLTGPYLGQSVPAERAVIFAPGIISTGLHDDAGPSFTRDGREILFRIAGKPYGIIGTMKEVDGVWTDPELASYSGHYPDGISDFSGDGKRIVFSSRRPLTGEGPPEEKSNLWTVTRTADGWSESVLLPAPINTGVSHQYLAAIADDGTLYFARRTLDDDVVSFRTMSAEYIDGVFGEPRAVEIPVDPTLMTIGGFVAPDESYMLMSIRDHPDGFGAEDLYVSFRESDDRWGIPINLGSDINSDDVDWMPRVTRDGNFLFFVSWRYEGEDWSSEDRSFADLVSLKRSARYGWGADIYWASTTAIKRLKPSK